MNTSVTITPIDLALCRATFYSALALGFRPPSDETISRLASEEGVSALADAAAALDRNRAGLETLTRALPARENTSAAVLTTRYLCLFGHTARGLISPYETEYGTEALFQQPQQLGDLAGFYLAFGLALNPAEHERADHISCECEFLSFLALKEAYALESRDSAMLEEVRKATSLFLRDHLGRFAPAFTRKLMSQEAGFYRALGKLCSVFISEECSRLGVPLGPENLALRPATDDRVPMACGSGDECAAMPGVCDPEGSSAA